MAAVEYKLRSELALACLPSPQRAIPRRLAWANSISLMFLIIGIAGAQSHLAPRKPLPPLEQPIPVIVEPPPPVEQQKTEIKPTESQNTDEKPAAPAVPQMVTIDTPAINFSVPTPGSLLSATAVAPEAERAAAVQTAASAPVKQEPQTIQSSGKEGDRPMAYPRMALELRQQGRVVVEVTVNDEGKVVKTSIQKSSGFPLLDQGAEETIRRRWKQLPANGSHVFLAPINFTLSTK